MHYCHPPQKPNLANDKRTEDASAVGTEGHLQPLWLNIDEFHFHLLISRCIILSCFFLGYLFSSDVVLIFSKNKNALMKFEPFSVVSSYYFLDCNKRYTALSTHLRETCFVSLSFICLRFEEEVPASDSLLQTVGVSSSADIHASFKRQFIISIKWALG